MVVGILGGQKAFQVILDQDFARFTVDGFAQDVGIALFFQKLDYGKFQPSPR